MLATETPSQSHPRLDEYSVDELVGAFVDDQEGALAAVRAARPHLVAAIAAAAPRIDAGGRFIYVGAGTSGRLGLLDSVELRPTFSWPQERALSVLAGGREAVFQAKEGAEDDREQGARDLAAVNPGPNDVAICVAASGTTPYVLGAMRAAREAGALTIGISNNRGTPVAGEAEIGIVLDTGPEVISGSTRLKAGTAQKIALNTISSAVMVRLNKVYGNLMVDMRASNAKLIRRTVNLTMLAAEVDEAAAREALEQCGHHVKTAIVMLKKSIGVDAARARLDAARGSVHAALKD